jgi:predicted Rossmann fold nucleotide-binding protein DprA/Smf involved in DNA uptake
MSASSLDLQTIPTDDPTYPAALKTCTAFKKTPSLTAIGNLSLLQSLTVGSPVPPLTALFCSIQCPADLVLKTYELAQALRDQGVPIISGFHSPVEQDCLKILLQGTQPIICCPARSLHKIRLSSQQQQAVAENRLLLLSPFSASYARATAELAEKRNELIGAIAQTIFIAYAAPNSKTQAFAQRLIQSGKLVMTLDRQRLLLVE